MNGLKGVLVLEDGSLFRGTLFGRVGDATGEVVFTTGMTGYEETLTDPSYRGYIVVMTYPLIGNYGINHVDAQSGPIQPRGFVVRENCTTPNHWMAKENLGSYLERHGVTGISEVDTRAVTRRIREKGAMNGCIAPDGYDYGELVRRAREWRMGDVVSEVTSNERVEIPGNGPHIAVIDLGVKRNILDSLKALGCRMTVVPRHARAFEIRALRPDGILISNGPGNPRLIPDVIATVRELLGEFPMFGICLGHQLIALAVGADSYKMRFGHRGANHPVKELSTGRVYITTQNHGYAIDGKSLERAGLRLTYYNINDGTVEGACHDGLNVSSVQFHPEGGPGPRDSGHIIEEFIQSLRRR